MKLIFHAKSQRKTQRRRVKAFRNMKLFEQAAPVLKNPGMWLADAKDEAREAGARRFSLTLGRTIELALLIKHAQCGR